MRQRLIQYVDLLFAGTAGTEDIKQEILQNTLDRFDDLVAQGKSEEAAYRLAITGIGDINEILAGAPAEQPPVQDFRSALREETEYIQHRKMRAVAIAMYICSAIPLFILAELGYSTLGLCMTILLCGAATYLILLTRKPDSDETEEKTPQDPRKKKLDRIVSIITLIIYLILSFATQAWLITWLVFPISGCVEGLINAIHDLKEACSNED